MNKFLLNIPDDVRHKLDSASKAHNKPITHLILGCIKRFLDDLDTRAEKFIKNKEKNDDSTEPQKPNG